MLCCRCLGLLKQASVILTTILNNTIYQIKTGHGSSAKTYMINTLYGILGVGQGSCAAPAIWSAILDTILWSVATKNKAFQMTNPTGKQTERLGDAYVDNTALMATSQQPTFTTQTQELAATTCMQAIAQNFERKLFTTGGALVFNKCFWYLISWK